MVYSRSEPVTVITARAQSAMIAPTLFRQKVFRMKLMPEGGMPYSM
jgi:hypothetical protein